MTQIKLEANKRVKFKIDDHLFHLTYTCFGTISKHLINNLWLIKPDPCDVLTGKEMLVHSSRIQPI